MLLWYFLNCLLYSVMSLKGITYQVRNKSYFYNYFYFTYLFRFICINYFSLNSFTSFSLIQTSISLNI